MANPRVPGDVAKEIRLDFERPRARRPASRCVICHPFIVHRATWRIVGRARMVAQPEIAHHQPFTLRDCADVCRWSGPSSAAWNNGARSLPNKSLDAPRAAGVSGLSSTLLRNLVDRAASTQTFDGFIYS